jgi:phosphoribosylformylglycinamidine synthase
LHLGLRALIHSGSVKNAHDCSEGGLAVALAECCISQQIARETPRLIGANVDLTAFQNLRLDALLFGESQARVVISVAPVDTTKVLERAKLLGLSAAKLGTVGGDKLTVKTASGEIAWNTRDLHDSWWNAIARLMKS